MGLDRKREARIKRGRRRRRRWSRRRWSRRNWGRWMEEIGGMQMEEGIEEKEKEAKRRAGLWV